MKKRNIVRFTAFLMAVLICLSTGLTLFAEGVDSTEAITEAEPRTVSGNDTEAKTVSDNDATTSTRSELGQKILDFKNPDSIKDKKLFGEWGFSYDDEHNPTKLVGFSKPEIQLTCIDGDLYFRVYKKSDDTLLYVTTGQFQSEDGSYYTDYFLTDDKSKETLISKDDIPTLDLANYFSDDYKDLYFVFYTKDKEMSYVVSYNDAIDYAGFIRTIRTDLFTSPTPTDNSTFNISVTPINEDGSVRSVTVDINFNLDLDYSSFRFDFKFNTGGVLENYQDRKDKLIKFIVYDSDFNTVKALNVDSLSSGDLSLQLSTGINGDYHYKAISLFGYIWDGTFSVDSFKEKDSPIISDEDLKGATVSFSGMPNEAYTDDSVTLKMNTDKKCKMSFNGSSLANDEYTTSADFVVSRNGTYSYTATNEQGVATNGTFEVTFFKDKVEDAIEDPLQMDLVSAKTDSNLSQTGLYQIWLIILAVILCSFGILLIVNQKYHFLDKFIRRFKHESN